MILLDLNILLYAINRSSPEHAKAHTWLDKALSEGHETLGLAWIVILGFLRLSTLPRLFPEPLATDQATDYIETLLAHPLVQKVLPGENHWALLKHLLTESGSAGNLVTDAHLAALALEYGATIATRDADFSRFPGIETLRPF